MSTARILCELGPDKLKAGASIEVGNEDHNHLTRALRAKVHDKVNIGVLNHKTELHSSITQITSKNTLLTVSSVEPWPIKAKTCVLVGNPKIKTTDFIVEKLVELGVTDIIFFKASRSQKEANSSRSHRLERIVLAAMKQSNARVKAEISLKEDLSSALKSISSNDEKPLIKLLCKPQATNFTHFMQNNQEETIKLKNSEENADLYLLVGPEGGLTKEEETLAEISGFRAVSFSENILRVETAVIAAVTTTQLLLR